MQEVTITRTALTSEAFTLDMLREVAIKLLGKTEDWVAKMAAGTLSKPSKNFANLSYNKLRTTLDKLLTDSPAEEYGELYAKGELTWEFECLPDLDIGNAGKNNKRERKTADGTTKTSKPRTSLSGAYEVVKRVDAANDPSKDAALRQHIWTSTTFEDYFAKADAKYVSATGRVVTANDEIRWALKNGWIKVAA